MGFVHEWLWETWSVLLQSGPWLAGGFLLAGFIHALVPVNRVTRHLGKPGLGGVLKAALVGAPLPLCSCSVIPVAAAIRRQGATKGATASFLVSTPETGVDSIAISYALLGGFMAVIRPIAAGVTAIVAGLAIDRLDRQTGRSENDPPPAAGDCCSTTARAGKHHTPAGAGESPSCEAPAAPQAGCAPSGQDTCHEPSNHGVSCCATEPFGSEVSATLLSRVGRRIMEALRYGFGRMFEDLAHWLVLGFVLAGLVAALFPPNLLEQYIGAGPWTMLLMLAIGLPMYVCATASTPVAAVLIAKGLSPGVALVFLLAGPATNAATMVVVARDLGRRSLAIYLASIAVVAVFFGLATDYLIAAAPMLGGSVHEHVHAEPTGVAWPFAVVLLLLILNGLRMRIVKRVAAAHEHAGAVPASGPTCCRQD
ncbi:MAG TPA: SO_0444 family Cu/Zn efflux transporter [Phycisphaerae bacterium]|nr:SO_0444 family Cu/Zn efflux transporter [Phycisphaerae bacterium]